MTTGRINQVTTVKAKMADRQTTAGFVNLDTTKDSAPRHAQSRPRLNTTSFKTPRVTPMRQRRTSRLTGSTTERAVSDVTPLTASQVIRQTFGQRPSTHRLSNKDGRLTTPICTTLDTVHHGSKT